MGTTRAAAGALVIALSLVSVIGGSAQAGNRQLPPGPCKTFTTESLDKLFSVDATATLKKKVTIEGSGTSTQADTCTVTDKDMAKPQHQLTVRTSLSQGGIGGPFTIYSRPKLGYGGQILVSSTSTFPETVATYERKDVYFADVYSVILKHKGKRLYNFALHQSKAFAKK